jgi:hypothetical protein
MMRSGRGDDHSELECLVAARRVHAPAYALHVAVEEHAPAIVLHDTTRVVLKAGKSKDTRLKSPQDRLGGHGQRPFAKSDHQN